jgi:hypothetical protein
MNQSKKIVLNDSEPWIHGTVQLNPNSPDNNNYRSGLAAAILGLEALFLPKMYNFLNFKFQAMITHSNRIAIEFCI